LPARFFFYRMDINMNPILITAPLIEPVTLAEAKVHLKIDHADEDTYISSLISSARRFCEKYTRGALIEQTWKWTLDRWPGSQDGCNTDLPPSLQSGEGRFIEIPVTPLISVTSITTYDDEDTGHRATLPRFSQRVLASSRVHMVSLKCPIIASGVDATPCPVVMLPESVVLDIGLAP